MAWFPWKTLSFLLLIGTAAIINLDVNRSGGSFKTSNTGQLLTDLGQYERVVSASSWALASSLQGRQWLEVQTRQGRLWASNTLPVYWAEGQKLAGPYLEVAGAKAGEVRALCLLGLARAQEAAGALLLQMEGAMPGLGARLEKGQVVAAKWGQDVVVKVGVLGASAKEGILQLVK